MSTHTHNSRMGGSACADTTAWGVALRLWIDSDPDAGRNQTAVGAHEVGHFHHYQPAEGIAPSALIQGF